MIESVDIGKRAEAYVRFAIWCQDQKMSPWTVAECIELCICIRRGVSWDKYQKIRTQIQERLEKFGATDIVFDGDNWPTFTSVIGERTKLPRKNFT